MWIIFSCMSVGKNLSKPTSKLDQFYSDTMEYHALCLQNLCRICANRAQKRKDIINKKPPKYVANYSDMIYVLFGIDIVNDDSSIHP